MVKSMSYVLRTAKDLQFLVSALATADEIAGIVTR